MNSSQNGTGEAGPPKRKRGLGQILFARFGATAILATVLLITIGWIGFLGWALIWLIA
ncbi:hypothetical protein MKK65_02490 [Methylobacterium sp. J-001]|uniref:hypothetical protein n=1 Tax=Methylobacterium sp. J-001 TaxID=2836609 RepID=UPI001FB9E996|nr:hypothetical protein [Methylobacterium sp. J-001]MCJ2115475.1 hypothetical protein [Methylobacterium sp. J-001]